MSAKVYVLEFGMGVVGLRVPGSDSLIACAAVTVSVEYPVQP